MDFNYQGFDPMKFAYGTASCKSGSVTLVMRREGNKVLAKEIRISAIIEDIYDFDYTRHIGTLSHSASVVQIGWEKPGRTGGRIFHSNVDVDVTYTSSTTYPDRPPPIQFFNDNGYLEDGLVKTPTGSGGSGGGGGASTGAPR